MTEANRENFSDLFASETEKKQDRGPVFKFKKNIKEKGGGETEKEFVSVLGIELEVNNEGRGTQFTADEFKDFSLEDTKTRELLLIYAKAIKLNQPPLVEGPTDIGKSKVLEYLAHQTNNHLIYQSFSGQTDVSELIGKYVPNTESEQKTFERLLSFKNRGALKPESLDILRQAEKDSRGLTPEECNNLAKLEGMNAKKIDWVWQDGTVPRALEADGGKGAWLYFDELGAAEPQILVKLNRIFSRGTKRLEITENGGREVVAGGNHRLIATTNPPSYAGREPFAKDFLRRWVYQKVGDLMPEDFLKRLDHVGHGSGGREENLPGGAIDLRAHGEIDHLLNEAITMFRFSAQKYLEAVPKDPGEQEFRLSDFTDALNVQEYLRQMQGGDLLETLKEAVEFYYLGKIDENKKDSGNKLVKDKMREILATIIDQKKIKEKLDEEIKKLKDPETAKKDQEFKTREADLMAKADALRKKLGLPEKKSGLSAVEFSAQTPEGKEVKINLAERLKYWQDFYQENKIDWIKLPDTISITPEQQAEMTRLITVHGFDNLIIIPENLTTDPAHYTKLHEIMSEGYATTYQSDNYKNDGGLSGSQDKRTGFRLILTKDVQNLKDDILFKSTQNLSVDKFESDFLPKHPGLTGLAESEYLILQRDYFKRTSKHLDESGWTWLPASTRPSSGRVPCGYWSVGGLHFYSKARGGQSDDLGCRLAGSFEI